MTVTVPRDQETASGSAPDGRSGAEGVEAQSAAATPSDTGRPEVEPMETNDVLIVGIGTALFTVAFLILLPMHASLERSGHGRWPWIALSGAVLGLLGLLYCLRRAQRMSKANGR
jgi:hypothetical protein